MENNTYIYEGKTVEEATQKGLQDLGLSQSDVKVEVKSKGGLFTKAQVIITVLEKEEVEEENSIQEESVENASEPESEVSESAEEAVVINAVQEELLARAEERAGAFINELVLQMGLDCQVEVSRKGTDINVKVTGKGSSSFIGYRGEVLDAIQYMTLWIANKEGVDFVRVTIDAEDYRQRRKETLTRLAERLAHKCHKTGKRVELEPMNPFERRVIHTALQNDRFVKTESEGEGRFRHVVIIPKEEVRRERTPKNNQSGVTAPQISYGTSASFRKKGISKTKSYGAPSKKPF
ncbi:MAG: protein jag [Clostridia bacterium]|nr:protein jag [Clostridia bacterium]